MSDVDTGNGARTGLDANEAERRRWNDAFWTSVWPRRERLTSEVTRYLLGHLTPGEGERVLDVGSGGGVATFAIAERVGDGSVVGADISGPLCELAGRRARERGIGNASFVVADAQCDPIPGAPFHAAASQFGVMFFDEPVRAFANIRAQVVPGGRLAFACWQEPARNPWIVAPAVAPFAPPAPPAADGKRSAGPFSLADADMTVALLEAAGWAEVTRCSHDVVVTVDRDVIVDDDQLRFHGVPEERLDQARDAVDGQLRPLARADGRYDIPLAFQLFTAISPG